MATTAVIISIGILVVSFLFGYILFYISFPLSKKLKKKQLEELTSLLINFVIYVWVGKIVTNFATFIQDPLSILAYPSNSMAFYIAIILILVNIIYKIKRHSLNANILLNTFIPVFFFSSFVYEFIQIILEKNDFGLPYLSLLFLFVLLIVTTERFRREKSLHILFIGWSLGQVLLSFVLPYVTIFGYIIHPIFHWIVLFILLLSYYFQNIRKVTS